MCRFFALAIDTYQTLVQDFLFFFPNFKFSVFSSLIVMSIAFERSTGDSIRRSGFIHGMPPSFMDGCNQDRRFPAVERRGEDLDEDSSSSSSIGINSDSSLDGEEAGEDSSESEVQSWLKGPLDTMDALEEVLPIKRGISKFYNGKSKSFTSLADASSASSIRDFAKAENPYTRKRKNLLARNNLLDKNCNRSTKDNGNGKRPATSHRSNLALGSCGSGMNYSKSNNKRDDSHLISASPPRLPPLYPHAKTSHGNGSCSPPPQRSSHWRSFSLSDLHCAAAATYKN